MQAMATAVASLLEVLYLRGDFIGLREIAESYIPRLQALGDTPQLVFALYFHCMLLEPSLRIPRRRGARKIGASALPGA